MEVSGNYPIFALLFLIYFKELERIEGKIESIRFYKEENGYLIASVSARGIKGQFIMLGNLMGARRTMTFAAEGVWFKDKIYGQEFKASKIEETIPDTDEGLIQYLSSGFIKGIGPAMAGRIVKRFGESTFDILDHYPERLLEIRGISEKKLESIIGQVAGHREMRGTLVFLKTYGITDNLAGKIYSRYQGRTREVITNDPYRLAEDIDGVGFKKADEIALKLGTDRYGGKRIAMGLNYVLTEGVNDKDTYIPIDDLIKRASSPDILGIHPDLVRERLLELTGDGSLKDDSGRIYLPHMYNIESSVGMMVARKGMSDMFDNPLSSADMDTDGVEYSPEQLNAIDIALKSRMTVITGGPGVGKTTILNGLLSVFKRHFYRVLLAAPTGRAAKRMSEAAHMEAKTIHRLLGWKDGDFTFNDRNPLSGDVLILDECSMVNLQLMHSLMMAIPLRMKLIMVGDVDQLPSIGCGTVLKDIIDSGMIPIAKLTKIYRQGNESRIILNAHAINDGKMPDLSNPNGTDFWFFRVGDNDRIREQVIRLVTEAIPQKFGIPISDIQVLTPMRKSGDIVGATQLNIALQERINPDGKSTANSFFRLRVGDRVMQNKNNYDLGVYNGDIGIISKISSEDGTLSVRFFGNDNDTEYDKSNIDELELAYAATVHKSQGSEYPAVVIVASRSHYVMLQKQLFYTAVTRARKLCVVVGGEDAVRIMVGTKPRDTRHSWLSQRIIDSMGQLDDKEIEID